MSFNQNLSSTFSQQKKFSWSFCEVELWCFAECQKAFCDCASEIGKRTPRVRVKLGASVKWASFQVTEVIKWIWWAGGEWAIMLLEFSAEGGKRFFFFFFRIGEFRRDSEIHPYSVLLESYYISQKTCLLKWKRQRPPPSPQPVPLQLQYVLYWSQGCYFDCCCS